MDTRGQPHTGLPGRTASGRRCRRLSPLLMCSVSKTQQLCGSGLIFPPFSLWRTRVRDQGSLRSTSQKVCVFPSHLWGPFDYKEEALTPNTIVQGCWESLPFLCSFVVFKCCRRTAVCGRKMHRAFPRKEQRGLLLWKNRSFFLADLIQSHDFK